MTDEHIRELFRELAEPVPPPRVHTTAGLWQRARRRRRRRRVGAAAAALALAVTTVGVLDLLRSMEPPPTASAQSAPGSRRGTIEVDGYRVDVAPRPNDEVRLPRIPTRLPDSKTVDPSTAVPLSAEPVTEALALIQPDNDVVYVLGADHRLRHLDTVSLLDVTDSAGGVQRPLDASSLSPDGRRAAFAQPNAVVIVDLTTGAHQRVRHHGRLENVRWLSDSTRLVAEGADRSVLIDVTKPAAPTLGYLDGGFDWVSESSQSPMVNPTRLAIDPHSREPELVDQGPGQTASAQPLPRLGKVISEWSGGGWLHGSRIARSAHTPVDGGIGARSGPGDISIVLGSTTGRIVRALLFPFEAPGIQPRLRSCCPVVGWLDASTVLLLSRTPTTTRLLAWDIDYGRLGFVTELPANANFAFGTITGP
ncbi:hypothetical protein [Thermomonospora umbrina]|uniref:WD40 repeat protein n=1 Tax=Thermomonospora umbrina TaxID=111806 RepID=A0A3D9SQZ2_9ACTN|nr:hypothetical protein [Thermomonospora umbrina]REE96920.1 hypothetical protein DFJ69_2373 [Thermomonospora umbrina]